MADLLKPSRNAVKDDLSKKHSNTGAEGTSYFGSHDLLGLLRVKAKGNNLLSPRSSARLYVNTTELYIYVQYIHTYLRYINTVIDAHVYQL